MNNSKSVMKYWKQLLILMVVVALVFFTVSSFLPIKYRADASVLITQKDSSGMDAYKEVKSAEFTGKIVSEVILSNAFMEGVVSSNDNARNFINIEKSPEDRISKWRDNIKIDQVANTGVLNVSFYSPSRENSRDILTSVIKLLQEEGQNYLGNNQLGVKVINKPYYTNNPASPNLLLNTLLGFFMTLGLIILFSQLFRDGFISFLESVFGKKTSRKTVFLSRSGNSIEESELERLESLFRD